MPPMEQFFSCGNQHGINRFRRARISFDAPYPRCAGLTHLQRDCPDIGTRCRYDFPTSIDPHHEGIAVRFSDAYPAGSAPLVRQPVVLLHELHWHAGEIISERCFSSNCHKRQRFEKYQLRGLSLMAILRRCHKKTRCQRSGIGF